MSEWIEPLTGATTEWLNFVAQVTPQQAEADRFLRPRRTRRRRPSPVPRAERPGSPAWQEMLTDHELVRKDYWARHRPPWMPRHHIGDADLQQMLAEINDFDRRFERALTNTHIDIAERALRRQEGHT